MKSCVEHGLDFVEDCMACASCKTQSWQDVSVSLAATNERACRVILAADELAAELEKLEESWRRCDRGYHEWRLKIALKALENYKIVRSGQ